MPRFVKVLLFLTVVAGLTVPAALAGNAHFIKSATGASITQSTLTATGGQLTCFFKEAGLEAGSTVTISCTGTASVTYECVNGGGKNPSATNKHTTETTFTLTDTFKVDKNGNVQDSVSGGPPSAADVGFSCPPGQTVTYVSVTYSNLKISDSTTLASVTVGGGTLSDTNPAAPPVS